MRFVAILFIILFKFARFFILPVSLCIVDLCKIQIDRIRENKPILHKVGYG